MSFITISSAVIPLIGNERTDSFSLVYASSKLNNKYRISNYKANISMYYATSFNGFSYLNSNNFYIVEFNDLLNLIKIINGLKDWN